MDKANEYKKELEKYLGVISPFSKSKIYHNTLESSFESLNDWSLFYTLEEVKSWFKEKTNKF